MADVRIHHNPVCGTLRNTLAMLRYAGIEPTVIEYLKAPPAQQALREMIGALLEILPVPMPTAFTKEDREFVTDDGRRRGCADPSSRVEKRTS